MKHFLSYLISLCLLAGLFTQISGPVQATSATIYDYSKIEVSDSTSQGLVLALTVPEVKLEMGVSDQGSCQMLRIPEWGLSGEAGEPALPIKGTLLGLPINSIPKVTLLETGPVITWKGVDLCPAATPVMSGDPTGEFTDLGEQRIVSPTAYAIDREFPGELALVSAPSMIRSQQVVQFLFQPIQYNPVTKELKSISSLRVRIDFEGTSFLQTSTAAIDEGPFETILRTQLANYETARPWRYLPETPPALLQSLLFTGPSYKLSINQDGMLRLTYASLQAAGLPVDTLDPRTFQMYNMDNEVAIFVQGETDGKFNAGDSIIFYGQKVSNRYTDTNTYWLTWGGDNGLRMASSNGSPTSETTPSTFRSTVHREENKLYMSAKPSGADMNHWYWEAVNPPSAATKTYTIDLTNVSGSGTARLRGFFKGYAANPQHAVSVSINNQFLFENSWAAQGDYSFDVEIPQSYLLEGTNTIKVECPLKDGITLNQVLVDWFEVDYNKRYVAEGAETRFNGDTAGNWDFAVTGFPSSNLLAWDITNPRSPIIITNALIEGTTAPFNLIFHQNITSKRHYLAVASDSIHFDGSILPATAADLHSSSNGADYIIITHPDFIQASQRLADYYLSRHLRVQIVNVLDIYDDFNHGVFSPQAIHDFLAFAYANWSRPAPSYVLLVGDGNYDFKNFSQYNEPNFIPPYLVNIDPWMGETAADNRYVTVSGADILPDMAIGRLPVQSSSDANTIVDKILNHYSTLSADWAKKVLFVAGNYDPSAGNFAQASDLIISSYLSSVAVDKVYYKVTHTTTTDARDAINAAFNTGRGIIHYSGHSSYYNWTGDINVPDSRETILLDVPGFASLTNAEKYPIMLSMTCYVGYFIRPSKVGSDRSVLDENLLRVHGKGAVATWSPTGQGVASGHDLLDAGFFQAIYSPQYPTLGLATNQAKYYLYANSGGQHRELIDTYVLFGDPAMLYQNTPTSASMNYFRAQKASDGVELSWETTNEVTTAAFNLYRRELTKDFVKLNSDYIPPQNGGQPEGSAYTYLDNNVLPGVSYEYRLDVIENSLQVSLSLTALYTPSIRYSIALPLMVR